MKKCKVCGVELDDQTDYCPQCGYCFTSGKTAEEQAAIGSALGYTVSDTLGTTASEYKPKAKVNEEKEVKREEPVKIEEKPAEETAVREEPVKPAEKEETIREEKAYGEEVRKEKVHKETKVPAEEKVRKETVRKEEIREEAEDAAEYKVAPVMDGGLKDKICLGLSAVAALEGLFAFLISVGLGFGFFRVVFNVLFYIGGNAMGIIALVLHVDKIKEKDTVSLAITLMSCLGILLNLVSGILMAF